MELKENYKFVLVCPLFYVCVYNCPNYILNSKMVTFIILVHPKDILGPKQVIFVKSISWSKVSTVKK